MDANDKLLLVQFKDEDGKELGPTLNVPYSISRDQLHVVWKELLQPEEVLACNFYVGQEEVSDKLSDLKFIETFNTERVLDVVYRLQAVYKVQAVTRCTSSLPGHSETVISTLFSPDGKSLASGSGDTTVRIWDLSTEMPRFKCTGHYGWVLCISWSPNGIKLASGCKSGRIILWDPENGQQLGKVLLGHRSWINALAWQPLHKDATCRFLASCSKDTDIRIWDTILFQAIRCLSGHKASVTCIRWGGEGLIYSGSQDRSIKMWRSDDGVLCRTFQDHGHWVNTIALHTDYVLRTGAFDPKDAHSAEANWSKWTDEERQKIATSRYEAIKGSGAERMVSGSDDFTLYLWSPSSSKKPVARMTGHHQLVNQAMFTPDGRLVASASFDHTIKIWCGFTGKFLTTLHGHVQAVYQIAWSSDSRLLVSGSADSTLKIWNAKAGKLLIDLPGHADEVYAIDWSPDGERVVSGGKDKVLKLWRK